MKLKFLITVMLYFSISLFGQKKAIDNNAHKNWEKLGEYEISNDGNFIWYRSEHWNSGAIFSEVVLTSIDKKKAWSFRNANKAIFTDDSQHLLLEFPDSIGLFNIAKMKVGFVHRSRSSRLISYNQKQLLAYQFSDTLVLRNLESGYEHKTTGVEEYSTVDASPIITLKTETGLSLLDVKTFRIQEIYEGAAINSQFDAKANLVAFLSKDKGGNPGLYICKPGQPAKLMVNNLSHGIEKGFALSEQPVQFSSDGNLVYFKLKRASRNIERDSNLTGAAVDIWNWKDQFIMSRQLATVEENLSRSFSAVLNIKTGKIIQLEDDNQELGSDSMTGRNKHVLTRNITNVDETYYNKNQIPIYKVVSLENGAVLPFELASTVLTRPSLSWNEQFILWTAAYGNKYIYEIATGITRNLTVKNNLPKDIFYMMFAGRDSLSWNESPNYWLANDCILVKDKFDYWLLDPTGKHPPTCITEGYGRKNNIDFELTVMTQEVASLKIGDHLLLKGRDIFTQQNGFFVAEINWNTKLKKGQLTDSGYSGFPVSVKKQKSNLGEGNYLLVRETVEKSPNLVITKDFEEFTQISDISPEKNYNWMTSEIMHWDMLDGKPGLGILYKPENFNPERRYPVIFLYYQIETRFKSNQYIAPSLCEGSLDIPWYVSNGYLVFLVDIPNYMPGKIASSTVNSVVSAAKYLPKFPWVDNTKMGLQGHSFGGYETNILVANTNIFAAASSAAGISNVISFSGVVTHGGRTGVSLAEVGQFNLGANPWTKPDVFIENSPTFKVDKITTPLLLQNNINDGAVPFMQGVEMFTAMRKAGKPVWLLQYDNQEHVVDGDAALDYTIRQQQFFDHYLKGKPMPVWMSKGIPAIDKGIRSGIEYEQSATK